MQAATITTLAESLGLTPRSGPEGIDIRLGPDEAVRLRRGSGNGGRAAEWSLVEVPSGRALVTRITSKRALRRALLEAMATALPAVVTDTGGNPEVIVQGETGALAPGSRPKISRAFAGRSFAGASLNLTPSL